MKRAYFGALLLVILPVLGQALHYTCSEGDCVFPGGVNDTYSCSFSDSCNCGSALLCSCEHIDGDCNCDNAGTCTGSFVDKDMYCDFATQCSAQFVRGSMYCGQADSCASSFTGGNTHCEDADYCSCENGDEDCYCGHSSTCSCSSNDGVCCYSSDTSVSYNSYDDTESSSDGCYSQSGSQGDDDDDDDDDEDDSWRTYFFAGFFSFVAFGWIVWCILYHIKVKPRLEARRLERRKKLEEKHKPSKQKIVEQNHAVSKIYEASADAPPAYEDAVRGSKYNGGGWEPEPDIDEIYKKPHKEKHRRKHGKRKRRKHSSKKGRPESENISIEDMPLIQKLLLAWEVFDIATDFYFSIFIASAYSSALGLLTFVATLNGCGLFYLELKYPRYMLISYALVWRAGIAVLCEDTVVAFAWLVTDNIPGDDAIDFFGFGTTMVTLLIGSLKFIFLSRVVCGCGYGCCPKCGDGNLLKRSRMVCLIFYVGGFNWIAFCLALFRWISSNDTDDGSSIAFMAMYFGYITLIFATYQLWKGVFKYPTHSNWHIEGEEEVDSVGDTCNDFCWLFKNPRK